jgi:hypothetical protein
MSLGGFWATLSRTRGRGTLCPTESIVVRDLGVWRELLEFDCERGPKFI